MPAVLRARALLGVPASSRQVRTYVGSQDAKTRAAAMAALAYCADEGAGEILARHALGDSASIGAAARWKGLQIRGSHDH